MMAINEGTLCVDLSFIVNIVVMSVYCLIVCLSGYFYGRHCGEYIREIHALHKLWIYFTSYGLLYLITIIWIYYTFFDPKALGVDADEVRNLFPWLTLYGICYFCYSVIWTAAFAHHSEWDHTAYVHCVCLLCTVFPLTLAILTFFLFQNKFVEQFEMEIFDTASSVPICLGIDWLSLGLTCIVVIALLHHWTVLCRTVCCWRDYMYFKPSKYQRTHSRGQSGMVVMKSDDSESEIEVNVQVPINRSPINRTTDVTNIHNGSMSYHSYDL